MRLPPVALHRAVAQDAIAILAHLEKFLHHETQRTNDKQGDYWRGYVEALDIVAAFVFWDEQYLSILDTDAGGAGF